MLAIMDANINGFTVFLSLLSLSLPLFPTLSPSLPLSPPLPHSLTLTPCSSPSSPLSHPHSLSLPLFPTLSPSLPVPPPLSHSLTLTPSPSPSSPLSHPHSLFLHRPLPSTSYVSRKHPRDASNHEILGVQQVKPAELAQMATLDINNSWGVLQAIVDVLRGFPREEKTSKYLILKDPNKVGTRTEVQSWALYFSVCKYCDSVAVRLMYTYTHVHWFCYYCTVSSSLW